MLKQLITVILLLLAVTFLSSCLQPSPPDVYYVNYKISRVTASGVEVNFNFDVKNSNPISIDVPKYAYKVFINGNELLSEEHNGFSLPPSDKKRIVIPVNIRYGALINGAASIIDRLAKGIDKFDYRIEGTITAGTLGISATSPIAASGTITIPKNI
ncbi:MAG: LEA type 2 family protein, partial [bacterium]